MSYIEPDGVVKLFVGYPYDKDYLHVREFADDNERDSYFDAFYGLQINKSSYQRYGKGAIRVEWSSAPEIMRVNYMRFKNSSFENRWFYAFVTEVEYVNNITWNIYYDIDVMETWLWDCTIKPCYVIREHPNHDIAGDNLLSEPVDLGQMITYDVTKTDYFDRYVVIVQTAYDYNNSAVATGAVYDGIYSGLKIYMWSCNTDDDIQAINDYIGLLTSAGHIDDVVSMTYFPSSFCGTNGDLQNEPAMRTWFVEKPTDLGGYVPRNQKLLTFPYCYLGVDAGNDSIEYRYERFKDRYDDNVCSFIFYGCKVGNPEIMLVPYDYDNWDENYNEVVIMSDFPQCAMAIDTYKVWFAQNAISMGVRLAATTATGVFNVLAPGTSTMSALSTQLNSTIGLANAFAEIARQQNMPKRTGGTAGGDVITGTKARNFYFKKIGVNSMQAQVIDNFFDRYGYETELNKVPNIRGRKNWNYVKTQGCEVECSYAPADAISQINKIFDNGVTFWHNDDSDYTMENPII